MAGSERLEKSINRRVVLSALAAIRVLWHQTLLVTPMRVARAVAFLVLASAAGLMAYAAQGDQKRGMAISSNFNRYRLAVPAV